MANRRYNTQTRKKFGEGTGKPISKSKNPGLIKLAKKKPELAKKFGYNAKRIVAKDGTKPPKKTMGSSISRDDKIKGGRPASESLNFIKQRQAFEKAKQKEKFLRSKNRTKARLPGVR